MFSNKWVAFGVGVAAGLAAAALIRTPAFRKACVAVTEKGMQLKQDAVAFMEPIAKRIRTFYQFINECNR